MACEKRGAQKAFPDVFMTQGAQKAHRRYDMDKCHRKHTERELAQIDDTSIESTFDLTSINPYTYLSASAFDRNIRYENNCSITTILKSNHFLKTPCI